MSIETLGTLLILVGVILGVVMIIRMAIALSDGGINNGARKGPARKEQDHSGSAIGRPGIG